MANPVLESIVKIHHFNRKLN